MPSAIIPLVYILLQYLYQVTASTDLCNGKVGKYPHPDKTLYHQCFHFKTKLIYILNKCPVDNNVPTCFSDKLKYCTKDCQDSVPSTTSATSIPGSSLLTVAPGTTSLTVAPGLTSLTDSTGSTSHTNTPGLTNSTVTLGSTQATNSGKPDLASMSTTYITSIAPATNHSSTSSSNITSPAITSNDTTTSRDNASSISTGLRSTLSGLSSTLPIGKTDLTTSITTTTFKPSTSLATATPTVNPDLNQMLTYNCSNPANLNFQCSSAPNKVDLLLPSHNDSSVYFRCSKTWNEWESLCYTCSKSDPQTCFSEAAQGCIKNEEGNSCNRTDKIVETRNCSGYSYFPCANLGKGYHSMPGDKSVYFECVEAANGGELVGKCHVCPGKGCYVEKVGKKVIERCVEDGCDPANSNDKAYQCSLEKEKSFLCTAEGLFANPLDTSIFFHCSLKNNVFQVACFSCRNGVGGRNKTCFSEESQRCVEYGDGENTKCPDISVLDENLNKIKGIPSESVAYSCDGYNNQSFTCRKNYGNGTKLEHPGDISVYFTCSEDNGKLVSKCHPCLNNQTDCFDNIKSECVNYCNETKLSRQCEIHKNEGSKCLQNTGRTFKNIPDDFVCFNSSLNTVCLECNNSTKICLNEEQPPCGSNWGMDCKSKEAFDRIIDGHTIDLTDYNCDEYKNVSFPCKNYEPGYYEVNDQNRWVYVVCKDEQKDAEQSLNNKPEQKLACHVCTKTSNDTCNKNLTKESVDNHTCEEIEKGKQFLPYSCELYNENSFPCEKPGLYANPNDTSIYFKCIRSNYGWVSVCFTCSNTSHTCFDEDKRSCVTNDGKPCGNCSVPKPVGEIKRTHDCSGYNLSPSTFNSLGPGVHALPGDRSVYFICEEVGDDFQIQCRTCPNVTKSCFIEKLGRCVENCGKIDPYVCQYHDDKSYPICMQEGYFAHPLESSIYFQCVRNGTEWSVICFTCNKDKHCYSETAQACLPNPIGYCGNATGTNVTVTGDQPPIASLTYTCEGYNFSFACDKLGPGIYENPGDKSVYFKCSEENGQLKVDCYTCLMGNHSCFVQEQGNCIENYGRGIVHKQYNCSTYDEKSYPCTNEGVFANPKDSSVYFQCI